MFSVFTNVDEYEVSKGRRGKSSKKIRFGKATPISSLIESKQYQTPKEIAIKKFLDSLRYSDIDNSKKTAFIDLLKLSNEIRFMNMSVLAKVFEWKVKNNINEITADQSITESIYDTVDDILGTIKQEKTEDEWYEIERMRMFATFIRYFNFIVNLENKKI